MASGSLGILTEKEMNSRLSLLSHSDTSQSTADSLDRPDNDTVFLPDDNSGRKLISDSLEELTSGKRNGKHDDSADSLENNKVVPRNGMSNSHHEANADNYKDIVKESQIPTLSKTKLQKSKTFDTATSVFNDKSAKSKFHDMDMSNNETGSGNHVFMTSQECMVVPGCSKIPRATIASRLRFEKHFSEKEKEKCHGGAQSTSQQSAEGYHKSCFVPEGYQTPLQRKDLLIKDLKRQLKEITLLCDAKDREISMYKQHVDEETSKLVQNKDAEISSLREELRVVKQSYADISSFCEESITAASRLEQKAEDLQHAMSDREKQHQKIYLEMYRKGQDSARFEREEELERLATAGGCKVTISELVKKLAWTELELAKWQTLRRQESYQEAQRPETEAEATMRFLKDSFFHYITDTRDCDHHLRAMIKIFKYTEPQMEKIRESPLILKIEKKYKKKSSKS